MNSKEIIESGILESYALGIASAEETKEVEMLLASDALIREELLRIQDNLNSYADLHKVAPPPNVKENIFNALNLQPEKNSEPSSSKTTVWQYAMAACIALLLGSVAANYFLYGKLKNASAENNRMTAVVDEMKTQTTKTQEAHQKEIAQLSDQLNRKIILKGVEKFPAGSVTVYWNEKTNEVTLYVNNLPAAPTGKQYQLWALKDGVPIDAGILDDKTDSVLQKMKDINGAQAFAITLENEGGVASPTLEAMYVMGNL